MSDVAALSVLARRLAAAGDLAGAVTHYDHALAVAPHLANLHYERAGCLIMLQRWEAALTGLDRLLVLAPQLADGWNNRAGVLQMLGRLEEALASIQQVLALHPGDARATYNAGAILLSLKRFEDAKTMLARAVELDPRNPDGLGHLASAMLRTCDWSGLERLMPDLLAGLRNNQLFIPSLTLMALVDDPQLQKLCAIRNWRRTLAESGKYAVLQYNRQAGGDRIHVGYLSSDFRDHPVAAQMVGVLRGHDRSRFQITCFAIGGDDGSARRREIAAASDRFIQLEQMDSRAAAQAIRDANIDILIDLNGQTMGWRPAILAQRPAPVIATWLGYAGTLGGSRADFLIGDAIATPCSDDFVERVIHLPGGFWPGTPGDAPPATSREQAGLPKEGFVFCCFNAQHKIRPTVFDIWMRLVKAVPGSVLWLRDGPQAMNARFCAEAAARGVDPERLRFAPRVPDFRQHLARLAAADLFLDTWPYNAHSTASDALQVGLPLLTLAGENFASRISASFLIQLGLPELIARSPQEYEDVALAMALTPGRTGALRARLTAARGSASFFDLAAHVADLEAAYRQMMTDSQPLNI